MNLNQLNKTELLEVLTTMTSELGSHLADSATSSLERYTDIDTNQMVYIIKAGQMKVSAEGLKHIIKTNPDELTLVNEKTSLAITATTTILTVETKTKENVDFLKGIVKYDFFEVSETEVLVDVPETGNYNIVYTMEFGFQQEKQQEA